MIRKSQYLRGLWLGLGLGVNLALAGCASLPRPKAAPGLEARLTSTAPGVRFGILVTDADGREVLSLNPDQRFIPASNTKLLTTAAAFAMLDVKAQARGTAVVLETPLGAKRPDVVLVGAGDGGFWDSPDCVSDCLSALAEAVAKTGVKTVGDVIGDDTLFPDERWGPGWSWDDMETSSGAAVSALTLNNNVLRLNVKPSAPGMPLAAQWKDAEDYLGLENLAVTLPAGQAGELRLERRPGSRTARLIGGLATDNPGFEMIVAVEDSADYAAFRFRKALMARGIEVKGEVRVRHRLPAVPERPAIAVTKPLAQLAGPPLIDDLRLINKQSQNLHAELMLRRLSVDMAGTGATEDGLKIVREVMAAANPEPLSYDLSDGSGLSTYNRLTPRMMINLLNWTMSQPWGADLKSTLPVGGVDGSLRRRFKGTALEGRIFAKTGRLNSVNSLSGFLIARSGRTLTFAVFANDRPLSGGSAIPAMDALLLDVAEMN